MNFIIFFAIIIAIIGGIIDGLNNVSKCKYKTKPSKNLLNFILVDPFEK